MHEMIHNFVGRKAELEQWDTLLLQDSAKVGCVVVVMGKYGMGKTRLLDRMVARAHDTSAVRVASLRYTITPNDSPGMLMKMMLEDALLAARSEAGSLEPSGKRFFQWNRFFRTFGFFSPKDEKNSELFQSLRYDPRKNIYEQFIARLEMFAEMLPTEGRLLLVVDPERDTPGMNVGQWTRIAQALPPKIVLLLAQRFKDTLAVSQEFCELPNVRFIPSREHPQGLEDLGDAEVAELVESYRPVLKDRIVDLSTLCRKFKDYGNHPFGVHTALNLFFCNEIRSPDDLPKDQTPKQVVPILWERIVKHRLSRVAVPLFEAYVVLDVPSLDEMVCWVADISMDSFQEILADPFLGSLLREEPDGRIPYHLYLTDYIRSFLVAEDGTPTIEAQNLHQRAMIAYGELIRRTFRPDALATIRFPEHALAVGGPELFAEAISQSANSFFSLGFYQSFASLIERGLKLVEPNGVEAVDLELQLGQLRENQGNRAEAIEQYRKSLQTARKITEPERIAYALFALGRIHTEMKQDAEAEQFLREAISHYETGSNPIDQVESLVLLGIVLHRQKKFVESESVLNEAVVRAKKIRNVRHRARSLAGVYNTWGNIFDEAGDYDRASGFYFKALDLTKEIYDREAEAELHSKIGAIFERSGNLKKAEENVVRSMSIHEELKSLELLAADCLKLAELAKKQGKSMLNQMNLYKAREIYRQLGNNHKADEIDDV